MAIDYDALPTPCYLVDVRLLTKNLTVLKNIREETGCRILLAQKAFSMYALYPLIGRYLDGTTASSLYEARLGKEEMGKETHIFSPAYPPEEFETVTRICDHIVFNSFTQWRRFRPAVESAQKTIECGIRVNPAYSEIETALYNPCAPYSRLGVPLAQFENEDLTGIAGLHFHTLCEQGADTLWRTIQAVDAQFGPFLRTLKWINFGGGHHITRAGYDIPLLVRSIRFMQEKYGLAVYLEPGEAVALNTGFLVTKVLDITENGMPIAILDASAACHMPDVLEMPYRPEIVGAGKPGVFPYTYRLGGNTCLAGDIIGDYAFPKPLQPGDTLVFQDMAHYTMVKNNTFNGIALPTIAVAEGENGATRVIRRFAYEDFKTRLS